MPPPFALRFSLKYCRPLKCFKFRRGIEGIQVRSRVVEVDPFRGYYTQYWSRRLTFPSKIWPKSSLSIMDNATKGFPRRTARCAASEHAFAASTPFQERWMHTAKEKTVHDQRPHEAARRACRNARLMVGSAQYRAGGAVELGGCFKNVIPYPKKKRAGVGGGQRGAGREGSTQAHTTGPQRALGLSSPPNLSSPHRPNAPSRKEITGQGRSRPNSIAQRD